MVDRYFDQIYSSILRPSVQNRGRRQLEFLKEHGLLPHHTLLDVGCSRLWIGQFIIPYLDVNNYSGVDTTPSVIRACKILINGLKEFYNKKPNVFLTLNEALDQGIVYDFGIISSVFNHNKIDLFVDYINALYKRVDNLFFDINISDVDSFYYVRSLTTSFSYDTINNKINNICRLHEVDGSWTGKLIDKSKFLGTLWVKRQIFKVEWL